MNNKKFRWIDDNIDISAFYDKLPKMIKQTISEAEQYDRDNCEPEYYNMCDDIEIKTKMLIPDVISHKEWELICAKYSLPCDD